MTAPQRFRSALNGFNREDVVNYIEYLNNRYTAQIDQLNNQLQESTVTVSDDVVAGLQAQLDAALLRCAELEEQLNAKQDETVSRELEAYRRAEEAERKANVRAQAIYSQAQTALAEATSMAESAAAEFSQVAERTAQQLQEYQASITSTVSSFKTAANALSAVDQDV